MNRETAIVSAPQMPGQITSEIHTAGDLLAELEDVLESLLLKCQVLTVCSCGTEALTEKQRDVELAPIAHDLYSKNLRLRDVNRKLRWLLTSIEI